MTRIVAGLAAGLLLAAGGATAGTVDRPAARLQAAPANLLANPGAEEGEGATDVSARPPVPGWETTSALTAVRYGTDTFPAPADSGRIRGGTNFFAGGPGSARSTATQTVDVSARAAEIDAGRLAATLAAWLGGWDGQGDAATVSAVYRSEANAVLGRTTIGPVTTADRANQTGFRERSAVDTLPVGTRSIQVVLTATRAAGSYNDGYADNISLSVGPAPVPVVGKSVNVTPVGGVVKVRVRGTNRFVDLARLRNVPVGSELDVTKGRVRLVSAAGGRKTQTGVFSQGRAIVRQVRAKVPVTTLVVSGPLACPKRSTAAAKPPRTRRLWGNGKGRFATRGRYASAAIRGTIWLTEDGCDGTLVRVRQGRVEVTDLVARRKVVIRAGQSYLARVP